MDRMSSGGGHSTGDYGGRWELLLRGVGLEVGGREGVCMSS
jgi:hypothetical protein